MTKEPIKPKAEAKAEVKAEVKPEVKSDTVKLYFPFDAIVDGEVVYTVGEHDVPRKGGSAERWIKRGAQVV